MIFLQHQLGSCEYLPESCEQRTPLSSELNKLSKHVHSTHVLDNSHSVFCSPKVVGTTCRIPHHTLTELAIAVAFCYVWGYIVLILNISNQINANEHCDWGQAPRPPFKIIFHQSFKYQIYGGGFCRFTTSYL